MLGRDRRRSAEHCDHMYGICCAGSGYAVQHAAFVADVMQAAVHQHYVVAASCQVHGLQLLITHVDTDTLGPGEPFDLLAGYRAHLDRIDLIAEFSKPDGVCALACPQIQCPSRTTFRRHGKQGGMKLGMRCRVGTVPVLTTPPVTLVSQHIAGRRRSGSAVRGQMPLPARYQTPAPSHSCALETQTSHWARYRAEPRLVGVGPQPDQRGEFRRRGSQVMLHDQRSAAGLLIQPNCPDGQHLVSDHQRRARANSRLKMRGKACAKQFQILDDLLTANRRIHPGHCGSRAESGTVQIPWPASRTVPQARTRSSRDNTHCQRTLQVYPDDENAMACARNQHVHAVERTPR